MALTTYDSFRSTSGWHAGTECLFNVLTEGRSRGKQASATVRKVPWGQVNVIHQGGAEVEKLGCTLYVPSLGELENLLACVGDYGTLTWEEGSRGALLYSVNAGDWYAGHQQTVQAEFWLT